MDKKSKCVKVGFSTILLTVTAILLCAAPSVWAEWQEVTYEGEGVVANISEPFEGIVYVKNGAELNLLVGGYISDSLNAQEGGTVNIKGGGVGFLVSAIEGAEVTVYGTDFQVNNGDVIQPPDSVNISYDTLTGKYGDGSDINLVFMSDVPIYLAAPGGGDPTPIVIDIKPGSDPNPINQGSNGLIPVAIFTTDSFDAADVDPDTVTLNGAGVAVRGKAEKLMARLEDVDGDGEDDLILQVETQSEGVVWETGQVTLTGKTYDGVDIEGTDEVVIVPPE